MANYKQSNLSGQEYQRCYAVSISNPLDATKQMGFAEEKIYVFNDTTINKMVPGCGVVYNPTATFPIIDPVTGEPTGATATQSQVYQMLYSLYIQTATGRDIQQQQP